MQTNRRSNLTARQEAINELIAHARKEVIYAEIQRDFLLDLDSKIANKSIDRSIEHAMFAGSSIKEVAENYNANYEFSLNKLNFLKDLRKKEQDKDAAKLAKRIKGTVPSEIRVDLVSEE